ncbi:MAG: HEAT repeat domain-containing protein [Proteobacteria bacterium]|nr:HEAT repeat domain-containing protein [Pseudomonadota bacterium]
MPDYRSWTVDRAASLIRHPNKDTRLAAVYRLSNEPGPAIHKLLAQSAQYDANPRIRYEAVMVLSKRREQASLGLFRYLSQNDQDAKVRAAADWAFKTMGGVDSAPATPPVRRAPPLPPPKPVVAIRHTPVTKQLPRHQIPIFTELNPEADVSKVILFYRTIGEQAFRKKVMKSHENGVAAVIGCDAVYAGPREIHYYIKALGPDGKPIGSSGSSDKPNRIVTVSKLRGEPPHLPNAPPADECFIIRHKPIAQSQHLYPIPVYAEINREIPVSKVLLSYRTPGEQTYTQEQMKPYGDKGKYFAFEISCNVMQTFDPVKIAYYIEVFDKKGRPFANSGSKETPNELAIVKNLKDDPPTLPDGVASTACTGSDQGQELPPGFWDGESAAIMNTSKKEKQTHTGFIPAVGLDGAIGMPRDTLVRTGIGGVMGLETGSFMNAYEGNSIASDNDFRLTDFSILLFGKLSLAEIIEIGIDLEVLTVEKLTHSQRLYYDDAGEWREIGEDNPRYDDNITDNGFSGVAVGFASANGKILFIRKDSLRMGIALRVTAPTHIGDRFDKGIGAAGLYKDVFEFDETADMLKNETTDGMMMAIEPGFIVSMVPIESLTLFADLTLITSVLWYTHERETRVQSESSNETSTDFANINLHLIPHIGAQYTILDGMIGIGLAIQPALYLGTSQDFKFVSMGLIPGAIFNFLESFYASLTVTAELLPLSAKPFLCPDFEDPSIATPPYGLGRRVGMAITAGYDF